MYSYLDILYTILSSYQKFLFYDASVSILKDRDFAHIVSFYKLYISYFIESLKDIENIDNACISAYKMKFVEETCSDILQHYCKQSHIISDKSREDIVNVLKESALIKKDNIKEVIYTSKDLINVIMCFNKAYSTLRNYSRAEIASLLTEFHNALSHLITAVVLKDKKNNSEMNEIAERNIDRAKSHFKRGTKDSYKIIIKAVYKLYEQYKSRNKYINMPEDFVKNFIEVRCREIIYLSNTAHHDNIQSSLKTVADKLISNFHLDKNIDFNEELYKTLTEYIISTGTR